MSDSGPDTTESAENLCLTGGGEMGALMRSFDWSATPLGPRCEWPSSLCTAVSICLNSRFPIVLWWGPELLLLYNDAWRPVLGARHPALAKPGREVWPEIWDIIGPMLDGVLATGKATWSDDQLLMVERFGYREEAYFTYSFSPIRDEPSHVAGVFAAVHETTPRVLSERRLRTLRELSMLAGQGKSVADACQRAVRTIADNSFDVPFALLYLLDDDAREAELVETTWEHHDDEAALPKVTLAHGAPTDSRWPLADVAASGRTITVDDLVKRFGPLPGSPWRLPPQKALVLPLRATGVERLSGVLIAGVNPCRNLDDDYRTFFELLAGHVATVVGNARAYDDRRTTEEALRRTSAALKEADRRKDEFLAVLGHELRNPLSPIRSGLELLKMEHGSSEVLSLMERQVQTLVRLVDDLLDMTRIMRGKIVLQEEAVPLEQIVRDAVETMRPLIESREQTVTVHVPDEPVWARGDAVRLKQVVDNLLHNASKYSDQHGAIAATLAVREGHAVIEVADNGIGIDAGTLPRVFDMFSQASGAIDRAQGGLGIGLTVVRRLVEMHGGRVAAYSDGPGRGSRFTVELPLAHPAAAPAPDQQSAPEVLSYRVLVVDDNVGAATILSRLIAKLGNHEVAVAHDGPATLEKASTFKPDVILLDIGLPMLNGYEVAQRLRADKRFADTLLVALTGYGQDDDRRKSREAGFDEHLTKPAGIDLLMEILRHPKLSRARMP